MKNKTLSIKWSIFLWVIVLAAWLDPGLEGLLRCDPITGLILGIGALGAGLKGFGATKDKTFTRGSQFEDTSTTEGARTKRQSNLFKEALDQLLASISAGPQVLQSDRNMMRTQTNNTYDAIRPRLESALTSRGFGQSGKMGSGFKDLEISRANQIQAGEAGLRNEAQQRFQQMLALALPFTRPDTYTTNRSGTSSGFGTEPGASPWSAAGSGLADFGGLLTANEAELQKFCCFIFLEALNGPLPWFVRELRDEYYSAEPLVAKGYSRTAKILVPLMRRSAVVKQVVNQLMVLPLISYGAYLKGLRGGRKENVSYKRFWFGVWRFIGRF